ncbi:MAG: type IV pilus secretin PilQ [Candidatus Omnitrophica bacterium]|nr:type IV pilus secretin PilQ [Candidatus Omnitrophota bacterium]
MNRKVAMWVVGIGLTFVSLCPAVYAQDGAVIDIQTTAPAAGPETPEIAKKNGLVSIDFRDADIKNVLKVLAYNSGVNIVAGPEVTGLVTIQLKDVPWQKALDVVLSTYGYAHERKGDIISVTTVENLKKRREDALVLAEQEPLVTETFTLNFGKASEIIGSIEKMKTPRGSINFDQRTNTLIVTDIQGNLDLMEDVVKALDAVTPQVVIEVKVVETTLTNTENLGIDWTIKGTAQGAKSPTVFPFKAGASSEFLSGAFPAPSATDFSYGTLNASTLTAVLELLKTRSNVNILSNPKIVTLDNQMARIVVGSQYPIPTYTYNEQQAKLQVSGWQYKDIGIIFEVTPHVNNAGFVTIDLQPKITAILDFVTVENTQLPRLSTEEAMTKVMIKDGDTLVIAGLIKDQVTDTKKRVPFLGDIPLLGEAFRKSEVKKEKTELMIFLTPHIITPELKTASSGTK